MGGRSGWSQQKRDRILQAECHGEAWRRVVNGEPIAEIVAEVRRLVGDRGRVLIETAGIGVGAWSARPNRRSTELLVAGILLEAAEGRGYEELAYWVDVGRDRALQPPHTASAGTEPIGEQRIDVSGGADRPPP
ncbi:hypothetical protein GCM10022204_26510 [Microlunatus aurantiacus]|uniref:Uncharacterized protein n=1 Tax=Microlunatus aurantiacus TaxID=446786 RepID=A0ABP7DLM0_9ACTN